MIEGGYSFFRFDVADFLFSALELPAEDDASRQRKDYSAK